MTALILINRVKVKFFVKIPEMPRISPATKKEKMIATTIVKRKSMTIGKSDVFGPNAKAIAPIIVVIIIPIK
jgi:hypothetical protein